MTPGTALTLLALFIWVSVSVGPWWLGALILTVGTIVNHVTKKK